MRNRRYLSLRVKLLKRQFGLPGDVLSLRSLSLASSTSRLDASATIDKDNNSSGGKAPGAAPKDRFSFSGVHQVSDSLSAPVNRILFGGDDRILAAASADGTVSVCDLADPAASSLLRGHSGAVLDLDLSQGGELAITCSDDGTLVLWDLPGRSVLRRVRPSLASHPTFCRFLPQNNNLVGIGPTIVDDAQCGLLTS